ncbi:Maf-like protein [Pigmentiphaga litoralis]|jgi:septum formation protein|uniref:Maf family nucleotide pyrophosphatase n=1 Tax=Pigmentiphaga litoralis TaxID=516702 RepID=UPI00167A1256|nr:Maf family nucleotide pyrophosphatase [Pigmentiphaga litoralis]GGX00531.1 Maf-like protein [Pigmentiphaga litoralis]
MATPTPLPRPLILASTSIYRRELLERLRLPFSVVSPGVDETPHPGESPVDLSLRLACAKARAVATLHPGSVVIGSDQVATIDGDPIGKPGSFDAALAQLQSMQGKNVSFHTALAVDDGVTVRTAVVDTRCRLRSLSDRALTAYLLAETPYDTAGSAKAEALGIALMERIDSDDPTALIGLPLIATTRLLAQFGLDPLDHLFSGDAA